MKKFELVAEISKEFFGRKLFRIRAMTSFGNVQTGDLGGWVESESNVEQSGNAWVSGDAKVYGNAQVSGDAWVYGNAHWISIGPIGSENGFLTAFRQRDNSIMVRRGCFSGTIDEFESAVNDTHSDNQHGDIYRALILVIKLRLAEVEGEQGGDHA
ncbi:hypothetical protein LU604_14765 [Erwinia tracheiphila]|uniref:Uncharacterized protein n=1 Tax=Erwinia tracheiphila TaxID=65700 RepID=A0A345CQ10_9GAMM|nr:hypothetical protein [Erwinia tracheiphila]AXF75527.1 hypothetical protein AV903_04450 [Erwinia tracheiphila]UIA81928.1 hypothetical protein LU604_14765 [Erwinia tracheiphila]UIA90524.1 hypothetical protein LU632_14340 [Erwinia tracheiphila]